MHRDRQRVACAVAFDEHRPRALRGLVARVEAPAQRIGDAHRVAAADLEQPKRRREDTETRVMRREEPRDEADLRGLARDVERLARRQRADLRERHGAPRLDGNSGAEQRREVALGTLRAERAGLEDPRDAVTLPQPALLEKAALEVVDLAFAARCARNPARCIEPDSRRATRGRDKRGSVGSGHRDRPRHARTDLPGVDRVEDGRGEVDDPGLAGSEDGAERRERLEDRRIASALRHHRRRRRREERRKGFGVAVHAQEGALAFRFAKEPDRASVRGSCADHGGQGRRRVERGAPESKIGGVACKQKRAAVGRRHRADVAPHFCRKHVTRRGCGGIGSSGRDAQRRELAALDRGPRLRGRRRRRSVAVDRREDPQRALDELPLAAEQEATAGIVGDGESHRRVVGAIGVEQRKQQRASLGRPGAPERDGDDVALEVHAVERDEERARQQARLVRSRRDDGARRRLRRSDACERRRRSEHGAKLLDERGRPRSKQADDVGREFARLSRCRIKRAHDEAGLGARQDLSAGPQHGVRERQGFVERVGPRVAPADRPVGEIGRQQDFRGHPRREERREERREFRDRPIGEVEADLGGGSRGRRVCGGPGGFGRRSLRRLVLRRGQRRSPVEGDGRSDHDRDEAPGDEAPRDEAPGDEASGRGQVGSGRSGVHSG